MFVFYVDPSCEDSRFHIIWRKLDLEAVTFAGMPGSIEKVNIEFVFFRSGARI